MKYIFFGLQYTIRSDIDREGPKNTTWRKVLAMVLLLAFVIALVVTIILLLLKDGLYKTFSGINVNIEILKKEKLLLMIIFDQWLILIHVHVFTFINNRQAV